MKIRKTQTPHPSKYEGQCRFCQQDFTRRQITKHVEKCTVRKLPKERSINGWRLRIGSQYANFWLIAEVSPKAKFQDLDRFLRDMWVDCCGHLSEFEGYSMDQVIMESLGIKDSAHYTYDFGTSTNLFIEAVAPSLFALPKGQKVHLVARNYMPHTPCVQCGGFADTICTHCQYEEGGFLCVEHAASHEEDCEEYDESYLMTLANSPRSGECGYEPAGELGVLFG